MYQQHNDAVFELVRERGLVDPGQLALLAHEARASGRGLADVMVEQGAMTADVLLQEAARANGCDYLADVPVTVLPHVSDLLSADIARRYGIVPLRVNAAEVELLTADPFDRRVWDDLPFILNRDIRLVSAAPDAVAALIRRCYGEADNGSEGSIRASAVPQGATAGGEDLSASRLATLAAEAPVVQFVDLILANAIRDRASDVHFEPFEAEFKIRYRVDGALFELTPPPLTLALPVTSRIKVLANLDIAERRVPQDGRIKIVIDGRSVDLRVSTLPTQFGESVVLRILDQSAVRLDVKELGLPDAVLSGVNEIVRRPNGIFIVTGPTGSGKTTTLYSCIRAINTVETKILTAEDPVEYEIEGVMQVPVNPLIGFTFATALRSFLRQDPDVIMVGEIRDLETAQIAIQASLTGHLVLSTLHTNDAIGAVARLTDMGVEPFLLANSLEGVLAQRLLRRVCPNCRTAAQPPSALLHQAGIDPAAISGHACSRGQGCARCGQTGYRGRLGVFEWLPVTEPLREHVLAGAPAVRLRQTAIDQGMRTLREEALRAWCDGHTSLDEVMRYT